MSALEFILTVFRDFFMAILQDPLNFLITALTSFTGIIAVSQWREHRYDKRVEDLKKVRGSIVLERHRYSDDCLKYYKRRFAGRDDVCIDYILYKKGWIQGAGNDDFIPLGDVSVEFSEGEWDSDRNPRFGKLPAPKDGYAENAKFYCSVPLSNRPLFGLSDVRTDADGKVTFGGCKGYYFDFYDTCEILSLEMAYQHRIKGRLDSEKQKLKLRDRVGDVFDLSNRFAGIGINVLTIIKNISLEDGEKSDYFLLHKRSAKNVAEGANSFHVVPAGSFQPTTLIMPEVLDEHDTSMVNTATREFYEELMGYEEFSELLSARLLTEKAEKLDIRYIGVGLDPLNTKAEVLAYVILDIDDLDMTLFENKKTKEDIIKKLKENDEGNVKLKPFTLPMLKQFRDNPSSIPAFRQILDVVIDHADFFGVRK